MAEVVQEMRLFSSKGERLYLNRTERKAFMEQARKDANRDAMIFCTLLHYTGARPVELLELTVDRVHADDNEIIFRSAKKRKTDTKGNIRQPHFRSVPIPPQIMDLLSLTYNVRARQVKSDTSLIWPSNYDLDKNKKTETPIDRKTAYNWVKANMKAVGLKGPNATSKGLRHGFAIAAVEKSIPINTIQKWLGHSSPLTTMIYASVTGEEEHAMIANMWKD